MSLTIWMAYGFSHSHPKLWISYFGFLIQKPFGDNALPIPIFPFLSQISKNSSRSGLHRPDSEALVPLHTVVSDTACICCSCHFTGTVRGEGRVGQDNITWLFTFCMKKKNIHNIHIILVCSNLTQILKVPKSVFVPILVILYICFHADFL